MDQPPQIPRRTLVATFLLGTVWAVLAYDWMWGHALEGLLPWRVGPPIVFWTGFTLTAIAAIRMIRWGRRQPSALTQSRVYSIAYVPLWHWLVFASDECNLDLVRSSAARVGLAGLFFIGLAWLVWYLGRAARYYEAIRGKTDVHDDITMQRARQLASGAAPVTSDPRRTRKRVWNPFNPYAWYYGHQGRKLNQSLVALTSYTVAFVLAFMLFSRLGGCNEIYELPAGGGVQKTIAQTVKIQKVIKKKFVVNPFSSIIFNPPPIDEVKLQLEQATAHLYKVGYGDGEGAGFGGGTKRGKVRFIRLEYQGGDWDQDFGIGADLNMLIQYGVMTGHPVFDQTESRTIAQLKNFPSGKSPPVVYLTGQRNISLSPSEVKILREYLLDKHGMLFGDNGGSYHFHNQFFAMMREVLGSGVEPVKVALDDEIHRIPFQIPFLPYVAPHGGKDAWGWKVDGRWVCYYHPGDIGDAWTDDHSGVPREIYEACYQLGTNVMFYANTEYSKWLAAQKK